MGTSCLQLPGQPWWLISPRRKAWANLAKKAYAHPGPIQPKIYAHHGPAQSKGSGKPGDTGLGGQGLLVAKSYHLG